MPADRTLLSRYPLALLFFFKFLFKMPTNHIANGILSLIPDARMIFAVLLFSLLACHGDLAKEQLELVPIQKIQIDGASLHEKLHQFSVQSTLDPTKLAIYDEAAHSILLASIENKTITHKIPLEAEGPNGFGPIRAICFINEARLAIFSAHHLGIIDFSGNVLLHKLITAGASKELKDIETDKYHPNPSLETLTNVQYISNANSIILLLNYFERDPFDFPSAYTKQVKIFAQYDIDDDRFSYLPIVYPDIIRSLRSSVFAKICYTYLPDNKLIYLFRGLSNHYVYDFENKTTQVIEGKYSKFVSDHPEPYLGDPANFSEQIRHVSNFPHYTTILYDTVNKQYYQHILNPVPDMNGSMKSYILIFDASQNYRGAVEVPEGHRAGGAVVYDGSILLPYFDKETDRFAYTVFQIKPVR